MQTLHILMEHVKCGLQEDIRKATLFLLPRPNTEGPASTMRSHENNSTTPQDLQNNCSPKIQGCHCSIRSPFFPERFNCSGVGNSSFYKRFGSLPDPRS